MIGPKHVGPIDWVIQRSQQPGWHACDHDPRRYVVENDGSGAHDASGTHAHAGAQRRPTPIRLSSPIVTLPPV